MSDKNNSSENDVKLEAYKRAEGYDKKDVGQ